MKTKPEKNIKFYPFRWEPAINSPTKEFTLHTRSNAYCLCVPVQYFAENARVNTLQNAYNYNAIIDIIY